MNTGSGLILGLTYSKDEYIANAVLKVSNRISADNIVYETLVGFFLNKQLFKFPSFVETYGLYDLRNTNLNGSTHDSITEQKQITDINCIEDFKKKYTDLNHINDVLNSDFNNYTKPQRERRLKNLRNNLLNQRTELDTNVTNYKIGKFDNNPDIVALIYLLDYKKKLMDDIENNLYLLECIKRNTLGKLITNSMSIEESDIISSSCKDHTKFAVLIQHLKGADNKKVKTIKDLINDVSFLRNDLFYILFQVYMTLSSISGEFTHYDLHDDNVIMYEPKQNSFIEYNYHIGTKIIVFKSKYIAKIIDFGRSAVNQPFKQKFIEWKNKEDETDETDETDEIKCAGIIIKLLSKDINISQDLRLLHLLKPQIYGEIQNLIYDNTYSTPEIKENGFPEKINNVNDAYEVLKKIVSKTEHINSNNDHYSTMQKLGDLHIYDDGRKMEYFPLFDPDKFI
jgi:hypothetical protein